MSLRLAQKKVIWFGFVLLLINSLIFLNKVHFDNEVRFGSDSGGYHLAAVNFAKGYGLINIGSVAGDYIKDYKFQAVIPDAYQEQFQQFLGRNTNGGYFNFYRTPGYIFFLGMIYKIFGVSPMIAKQIQLLLVVAVASSLPFLGYHYWKKTGLVSGLTGMVIYLRQYAQNLPNSTGLSYPNITMAEPLISFCLMLFVFGFILWQKKKSFLTALILGGLTGINLLVKGSTIFLPFLTLGYFLSLKRGKIRLWPSLAGYIGGLVLLILPWSIYASKVSGQTIILSTQGEAALLTNHNELAIDGSWHKEAIFHDQPEIVSWSVPKKLLAFYTAYPEFIPEIFFAKVNRGFNQYRYLILALILINYKLALQFIKSKLKKSKTTISFNLSFLLAVPVIALGLDYFKKGWGRQTMDQFTSINPLLAGSFLLILIHKITLKKPVDLDVPTPLIIIFLNFLIIILASSGIPRNIQVIDFIFILVFFQQLLSFLKITYQGVKVRQA